MILQYWTHFKHSPLLRDEETGVAATRRAFTAVVPDQRMDSDSDNDEDGFSDAEDQAEEFEVKSCSAYKDFHDSIHVLFQILSVSRGVCQCGGCMTISPDVIWNCIAGGDRRR